MPGDVVDGQDVDTVHAAAQEAVARARAGDGPTLLEMKTYRFRGHSRTDPAKLPAARASSTRWQERDPITILGARLAEQGTLSEADQDALREEIQQQVDETADARQAGPAPDARGGAQLCLRRLSACRRRSATRSR